MAVTTKAEKLASLFLPICCIEKCTFDTYSG